MNKNVKAKIGLPHKTKPSFILFSILLISLYFSNIAAKPFLLYILKAGQIPAFLHL